MPKKFVPLGETASPADSGTVVTEPPVTAPQAGKKFIPLGEQIQATGYTGVTPEQQQAQKRYVEELNSPLAVGADWIASGLPLVMGAAGEMTGGPLGGGVSTAIGSLARNKIHESLYPQASTPMQAMAGDNPALEAGMNAALSLMLGPLASTLSKGRQFVGTGSKQRLMEGMLTKLFPGKTAPEDVKLAINYDLEPTVGQQGSKLAQFMERNFAPRAKAEREAIQQSKISQRIMQERQRMTGFSSTTPVETESYAQPAQAEIIRHYGEAKGATRRAYEAFENQHEAANTMKLNRIIGYENSKVIDPATGQSIKIPKTEEVEIKGAILTPNSTAFAAQIKPEIDAFVKGDSFQALEPWQKLKLTKIQQAVEDLSNGVATVAPDGTKATIPVKEWRKIKEFRTDINSSIGGKVFPNLPEGGLRKLSELLEKDIDDSITLGWKNGAAAKQALEKANAANKYLRDTFDEEITNKVFRGGDIREKGDPSELFNVAYQSPEKARRFIAALGPQNAKEIKGDYFDNVLYKKAYDTASRKFNPDAIIKELEDPNSVSREIYTSAERRGMLDFMRAVRSVSPDEKLTGNYSLAYRGGLFALTVLAGGARALSGHEINVGTVTGVGGLTAMWGAHEFSKRILLNPKNAAIAARLVKAPPTSVTAAELSKKLLYLMRGTQVILNTPMGKRSATITDNGKFKIATNDTEEVQ